MNRKNKIILNIVLIFFILFGFILINGYYISKSKCIDDTLKVLYTNHSYTHITSYENKNSTVALLLEEDNSHFLLMGLTKYGPFYRSHDVEQYDCIHPTDDFIVARKDIEDDTIYYIYRENKDIDLIELTLKDGTVIQFHNWNYDFSSYVDSREVYLNEAIWKAYDKNHTLISAKEMHK